MSKYIKRVVLGCVAITGLFFAAFIVLDVLMAPAPVQPAQPTTHPDPPASLRQDPQVVAVMHQLGLDYSKLNLIYGDNPNLPAGQYASFSVPDYMFLSPTFDTSKGNIHIAVSHEYIHYVQYTLNPTEAQSFYPYMDSLMSSNAWLHARLAPYRTGEVCKNNCIDLRGEAEAYACTEMTDKRLQANFVAFCNTYLPHRYSLL